MFIIAAIAAGYVAYAAPSHEDAYEAFADRVLEAWTERGQSAAHFRVRREPNFPAFLTVERCEQRKEQDIIRPSGVPDRESGYDCLLEVFPNAAPNFRTRGFFYYDGLEWVYFGAIYPRDIPNLSEFNSLDGEGEFTLKEGAQDYDGTPRNPYYDNYDPYRELYRSSDKYDQPNY